MVVAANVVTEKDGIPVLYPQVKRGFGVRVIHPQNPKAPSKNFQIALLYIAPGGVLENHTHEEEEAYVILEGEGEGDFGLENPVRVEKGMFFHLPPYANHGIKNTGQTMMKVLLATSPPIRPYPEWQFPG